MIGECTLLCVECIASDPEELIQELIGDSTRCLTVDVHQRISLEDMGFRKVNENDYESGFHSGQDDTPDEAIKALQASGVIGDDTEYLFVQTEQSQFYTCWAVYVREPEE
jgi:hypothetical protein